MIPFSLLSQTVFSNFFHGQMYFHAKALELYTTAIQNLVSMDEEQDIEVIYLLLLLCFFFYLKFHICYLLFIIYVKEQVCGKARESRSEGRCIARENLQAKLAGSVSSARKHGSRCIVREKLVSSVMHRKTCKLQTPTQLLLCMGCDCARQIAFSYFFARINICCDWVRVCCKLCYAQESMEAAA